MVMMMKDQNPSRTKVLVASACREASPDVFNDPSFSGKRLGTPTHDEHFCWSELPTRNRLTISNADVLVFMHLCDDRMKCCFGFQRPQDIIS